MIDSIINTIEDNNMIKFGDKIVVGLSGGPDSMCLIHILYNLKQRYGISLVAAHINHCLRGKEADNDEKYVEQFCKEYDIEFYSTKVDVNKMCKEKNMSCETVGRQVRYSFFEDVLKKTNAQKIALAHNANDQCETVLMRIMRGTGMKGLIGIKPVRDNRYIRPIINCVRSEIEEYCEKNNINPRIDKTNLETIYTRNKIRLELIPYMEKNFNSDLISSVNRLSRNITIDNEFIENIALEKFKKYCSLDEGKMIIKNKAFKEPTAIVNRIIRLSIDKINGNLYNCEKIHIDNIVNFQKKSTGKFIELPNKVIVYNNYGNIIIYKNNKLHEKICNKKDKRKYLLKLGKNHICNKLVELTVVKNSKNMKFNNKLNIKYFDFDKINGNIMLRYRKDGDRVTPLGMKGSKKLKDLFIDLKISKDKRDNIPIICFNEEIAWIVGYRVSDKFKVGANTKQILKIIVRSEEIR